jgi:predicted Holliday junction resolvase-like endonuclease
MMLTYALIVTVIALAATGVAVTIWKRSRERIADVARELDEAIKANRSLQREIKRREHIIRRQQEVQIETEEKKREVRKHADPVDRANAATRLMSDLAGSSDGD